MSADLLLEVGSEEIPASFIEPALAKLVSDVTAACAEARLAHGPPRSYGTPRRLAVYLPAVADKGEDVVREVLGPSVKSAFDKDGKPTRAAEKFAESLKLRPDQLARVATPKGEYVGAKVEEKGKSAAEILRDVTYRAVHAIEFKKSMRWGDGELAFARPVHWLVALLGGEVLPVVLGDVRSGRCTYGHRFLSAGAIELRSASDYEAALEKAHVIASVEKRKALLVSRIQEAAKTAGAKVLEDAALVDQVTNLVELPNPVVGTFEERHLDLPPEVLIQEMRGHQRYFSLVDGEGKLLPRFIAVSNTPVKDVKLSVRGYERVLRARLADGRFFFDEDRRAPLASRLEKLTRVVWQGKLGSYAEKVARIQDLAGRLARSTGHAKALPTVERAAALCKADLVTGMVGEFPELQGVMGREYARHGGEPAEVAEAIFEHYLPRHATDALPTQDAGALVGLADRLDSLCGIFAIGKKPSGAADPFALRRACLAVIRVTLGRGYRYRLSEVIDAALALHAPKTADIKRKPTDPPVREEILGFFGDRLESLWAGDHRTDVVKAVLAAGFDDLVAAQRRLAALSAIVGRSDFVPLAVAFKRVVNIVEKQAKDVAGGPADPARFVEPAERALFDGLAKAQGRVQELLQVDDFAGALKEITALKPAIDQFFDKVMVMAEDRALRENRVRLLVAIGSLFGPIADFSQIQAEVT